MNMIDISLMPDENHRIIIVTYHPGTNNQIYSRPLCKHHWLSLGQFIGYMIHMVEFRIEGYTKEECLWCTWDKIKDISD